MEYDDIDFPSYLNISNSELYLKCEDLIDGALYEIVSRNLYVGVWSKEKEGFIGIREKFDNKFLFTEHCYEHGGVYGTARAYKLIAETLPKHIEAKEILGTIDKTNNRKIYFKKDEGSLQGKWYYCDDNTRLPKDSEIVSLTNEELFHYLTPYDTEIGGHRQRQWEAYRKQLREQQH